jgi:lactoylglutathione lyase
MRLCLTIATPKTIRMDIRLIVLRTPDIISLSDFYKCLGLNFEYHKHGKSPFHYGATIGKTVLEIYPLAKDQVEPDKNLRLGFSIDNFEAVIQELKTKNVRFISEPIDTEFGHMAIIEDPDQRKLELYKNK